MEPGLARMEERLLSRLHKDGPLVGVIPCLFGLGLLWQSSILKLPRECLLQTLFVAWLRVPDRRFRLNVVRVEETFGACGPTKPTDLHLLHRV